MLLATAPDAGGGPAAALPWEGTTLLGRLIGQLAAQDVSELHVVTRPAWAPALESWLGDHAPGVRLHPSPDRAADLRALEALAADGDGGLVVANADVLTQGEAVAGLLADPRVPTGILATRRRVSRLTAFGTVSRRGRVMRAGSPYHRVVEPNGSFLGVLKIGAADRPALAEVSRALAGQLDDALPEAWHDAFAAKVRGWRLMLNRQATAEGAETNGHEYDKVELTPARADELQRRLAAAEQDVTALLLHGLVAAAVPVRNGLLGRRFWARPLSHADLEQAADRIGQFDEEDARLKSAVKSNDGFFTTFFVSPYSKYIARWAARRGWSPNAVTILSMSIGLLAAAAFATGERAGLVAGAVLLQIAFTFDCVDGQLARYTRTFTRLGAWLDSIFDRSKEYAVFAGLAIGSAHAGDDVWLLAGAALVLQTVRHSMDSTFNIAMDQAVTRARRPPVRSAQVAPSRGLRPTLAALDGPGPARWVKKLVGFPIGERFAAISITAALFDARVTFIVLLAWGGLATGYRTIGRLLRSLGPEGATTLPRRSTLGPEPFAAFRDDGLAARLLGRVLGPLLRVPPISVVAAGAAPLLVAAALAGDGASWGLAAAVVGWAVLVVGASSGRLPPRDRLRWTIVPAVRLVEYAGLLWIAALAGAQAVPAAFALLCAIAFRHYDTVYRFLQRRPGTPRWLDRVAGGWDGRLIAGLLVAIAGAVPAAFYVAAGVLGAAFAGETIAGWKTYRRSGRPPEPLDRDDGE